MKQYLRIVINFKNEEQKTFEFDHPAFTIIQGDTLIIFEWTIKDTRGYGFRTGTSKFVVKAKNQIEAINEVIKFAALLPDWEFERNGIDLNEYRDGNACTYHFETRINKILSVKVYKEN